MKLYTIIPAVMLSTLLFFGVEHMNYSWNDWINGNIIVASCIGLFYLGNYAYGRFKK